MGKKLQNKATCNGRRFPKNITGAGLCQKLLTKGTKNPIASIIKPLTRATIQNRNQPRPLFIAKNYTPHENQVTKTNSDWLKNVTHHAWWCRTNQSEIRSGQLSKGVGVATVFPNYWRIRSNPSFSGGASNFGFLLRKLNSLIFKVRLTSDTYRMPTIMLQGN